MRKEVAIDGMNPINEKLEWMNLVVQNLLLSLHATGSIQTSVADRSPIHVTSNVPSLPPDFWRGHAALGKSQRFLSGRVEPIRPIQCHCSVALPTIVIGSDLRRSSRGSPVPALGGDEARSSRRCRDGRRTMSFPTSPPDPERRRDCQDPSR